MCGNEDDNEGSDEVQRWAGRKAFGSGFGRVVPVNGEGGENGG